MRLRPSSANLQLKDIYSFQAATIHRDAIPIAGSQHCHATRRAEMVAAIGVTPKVRGKLALLCEQLHCLHWHLPVDESRACAGRTIALLESGQFSIDRKLDGAAVAGEPIRP